MSLCVHACVYGDLKLMWAIFSIDLLSYSLSSPGSLNQTQVINFACQLAPETCFTERAYKRAAMSSWPLHWCRGFKLWLVCLCGNFFNFWPVFLALLKFIFFNYYDSFGFHSVYIFNHTLLHSSTPPRCPHFSLLTIEAEENCKSKTWHLIFLLASYSWAYSLPWSTADIPSVSPMKTIDGFLLWQVHF